MVGASSRQLGFHGFELRTMGRLMAILLATSNALMICHSPKKNRLKCKKQLDLVQPHLIYWAR